MLRKKGLDVLGLAETFLQLDQEGEVGGYVWYGMNRVGVKKASGGVGLLVKEEIESRLLAKKEGLLWVKIGLSGGRKLAVACVYVNPEGVRSRGGCARVIKRHVTTLTSASYCIENSTEFNFCTTFSNLLWNAV